MAEIKVQEVVAKAAEGKALSEAETKAVMQAQDTEEVIEVQEKKAPAPEPDKKEPEKDGKDKEGEPEAEPEDTDGEKEGEKDTEETPSDKEEADPSEADKQKDDVKARLEKELEKPYGEEDLTDYSPRERALFYEMRRERRKRQDKQEELDLLRFKHLQEKTKEPAKEPAEEPKKEPAKDPFEGKDEDEFLTVGDVKKILKENSPKPGTKEESKLMDLNRNLMMRNWFLEGQMKHDDFLDVVNMAPDILEGDQNAATEIMETARRGGNAALTTYNLVKSSSKFKGKPAKAEGSDDDEGRDVNKDRAKRIEENAKKPRTTGGSGSGATPPGEYTLEEIVNMPQEDFMKIKPEKRQKLLKKFEGIL